MLVHALMGQSNNVGHSEDSKSAVVLEWTPDLPVPLQVLADGHGLLDQVVQVLGQVRGQAFGLQDPQDLVARDKAYLGHPVGVPQNHTWGGDASLGLKASRPVQTRRRSGVNPNPGSGHKLFCVQRNSREKQSSRTGQ